MIVFKPKRPDSLTPFFDSQAAREACDQAYDRYQELYFEYLGGGYYSAYQAQSEAEHQAWYSLALTLQRMIAYGGIK